MTLTLRFLRWLEFKISVWKQGCKQEKLKSLVIYAIEDGAKLEDIPEYSTVVKIYGEYSQDVINLRQLFRLQEFKRSIKK